MSCRKYSTHPVCDPLFRTFSFSPLGIVYNNKQCMYIMMYFCRSKRLVGFTRTLPTEGLTTKDLGLEIPLLEAIMRDIHIKKTKVKFREAWVQMENQIAGGKLTNMNVNGVSPFHWLLPGLQGLHHVWRYGLRRAVPRRNKGTGELVQGFAKRHVIDRLKQTYHTSTKFAMERVVTRTIHNSQGPGPTHIHIQSHTRTHTHIHTHTHTHTHTIPKARGPHTFTFSPTHTHLHTHTSQTHKAYTHIRFTCLVPWT